MILFHAYKYMSTFLTFSKTNIKLKRYTVAFKNKVIFIIIM